MRSITTFSAVSRVTTTMTTKEWFVPCGYFRVGRDAIGAPLLYLWGPTGLSYNATQHSTARECGTLCCGEAGDGWGPGLGGEWKEVDMILIASTAGELMTIFDLPIQPSLFLSGSIYLQLSASGVHDQPQQAQAFRPGSIFGRLVCTGTYLPS
ncbi:hypothetical protein EX30DRAFT_203919 [Ascodesmis nigricans]|uniref:Uncharacterized protein n=1 Tax=Ascodesmis nigricans TaxID=341454 RepID=A0A4S2MK34_9PEZI|nr:hypothetical protein EX30DRAFT_203919 [Ascodesmis nigricans]